MKNVSTILVASLFLVTISCQKGDEKIEKNLVSPLKNCLVSGIETNGLGITYQYDSSKRIINVSGKKYLYSSGKVKIEDFLKPFSKTINIDLNNQGNAISSKYLMFNVEGDSFEQQITTSVYSYNSDQYLIKKIDSSFINKSNQHYQIIEEYNYQYLNDNMVQSNYTNTKGTNFIRKYTYTNFINQLSELEQKLYFNGKQSKNLVESIEEISPGGSSVISTYSYTFDKEGKLETETVKNGGNTSIRNFYWDCKE